MAEDEILYQADVLGDGTVCSRCLCQNEATTTYLFRPSMPALVVLVVPIVVVVQRKIVVPCDDTQYEKRSHTPMSERRTGRRRAGCKHTLELTSSSDAGGRLSTPSCAGSRSRCPRR